MEMIQRDFWFIKKFERVAFLIVLISPALLATSCLTILVAQKVSENVFRQSMTEVYLDQTQALRFDQGLSFDQFDQEMWDYVPDQYAKILKDRIRSYTLANRKIGPRGEEAKSLADFPELHARYKEIQKQKLEYSGHESFWDMKSMAYRAFRLSDSVSEDTIISELRQMDMSFDLRYEEYHQKRLSKGSDGR